MIDNINYLNKGVNLSKIEENSMEESRDVSCNSKSANRSEKSLNAFECKLLDDSEDDQSSEQN